MPNRSKSQPRASRDLNLRTGETLWHSLRYPRIPARELTGSLTTDVVIIGSGITGAMAAEELSSAGFKVVILDRRGPLKGSTSATTALLQYEIDQPLLKMQDQIGHYKATRAWRRSRLGLDSLCAKIESLRIACGVNQRTSLYLAGAMLDASQLQQECDLRNEIGLHTDYLTRQTLLQEYGIRRNAALRSFNNLTANPLRLAGGFLEAAIERGAVVFAPVTVDEVEAHKSGVAITTKGGQVVKSNHLIYATGYEIPSLVESRKHTIHSTYAIATRKQADKFWLDRCLIWEASDPYLYVRTTEDGRVICGGEDEDFEDEEKRDALLPKKTAALERKLAKLFPQLDTRADFAWTGCFGSSRTGLPTIGPIPGHPNCYTIMAFGGNGITFSRIAAEIIRSRLTGKHDPDADLFEL